MFSKGVFGQITAYISGMSNETILDKSDAFQQLYSYVSVYSSFGVLAVVVGLLVIVLATPIKKWMHGIS